MKKIMIVLFVFLSVFGWSQNFESIVDFSVELSSLSDPGILASAEGKIVILEGLMNDSQIDDSSGEVKVWVQLAGGKWMGTEDVQSYFCRILFTGESWLEFFPPTKPRNPSSNYIPQGSRLLVAARIIGNDAVDGIPLAEMVDYRILN